MGKNKVTLAFPDALDFMNYMLDGKTRKVWFKTEGKKITAMVEEVE